MNLNYVSEMPLEITSELFNKRDITNDDYIELLNTIKNLSN